MQWSLRLLVFVFVTALVGAVGPSAGGVVPGDDGLIAFTTSSQRIATIQSDGSGLAVLPGDEGVFDMAPAWSPDGARIAYVRYSEGSDTDLWVMDADGSHRRIATTSPRTDHEPAWAPDGSALVFWRIGPRGGHHLRIKVLDGSRSVLVPTGVSSFAPDWSPDGSTIAFMRRGGDLYTVRPDGSDLTQLTATPNRFEMDPQWSPDGDLIVFTGEVTGAEAEIYTLRLADGEVRNLTNTADVYEAWPAWAPSGGRIVYSTGTLWIIDALGGAGTQVPNAQGSEPDWQPLPET